MRETEERLRQMAEHVQDVFWLVDVQKDTVLYATPAYERVWGRPLSHLYSKPWAWLEGVHPDDRAHARQVILDRRATGLPLVAEYRIVRPDGAVRWVSNQGWPIRNEAGDIYRVAGVSRDITERKEAETQAQWYQQRLQSLALEVSLAEERERHALATNLHDGVSQLLTAAQIRLTLVRNHGENVDREQMLGEIEQLLARAERSARSLTLQLSPPVLYELGFIAAAQWLADDMRSVFGLKVTFEDDGKAKPMDIRLRVILFQCLRELLTNVAKHARTDEARVCVRTGRKSIRLVVFDRGVGFDTRTITRRDASAGFGLFSIRERIHYLRGRALLRSSPAQGTIVLLKLPIDAAMSSEARGNSDAREKPVERENPEARR